MMICLKGEDMGKRYMTQLNIWLESTDTVVRCEAMKLIEGLRREGIAVIEADLPDDGLDKESLSGILWLTDSVHAVHSLTEKQLPVVVWLHEGNRNCSFASARYAVECAYELGGDFYDRIYRRYAGIPWDILETDRCLVRETRVEDVSALIDIYRNPNITRYTEPFCQEPDAEREYVKEYIEKVYDFYGYGVWTVVWKASGEVIGRVGFEQSEHPYLGYMIGENWQGQGIAFEVCQAVLEMAKAELGMDTVRVQIDKSNLPSLRLAQKLGFEYQSLIEKGGRRLWVMARKL